MEPVVVERQIRSQPGNPGLLARQARLEAVERAKAELRFARLVYDDLSAEVAFAIDRVRRAVELAKRAS